MASYIIMALAATLICAQTGRVMDVITDQPGVQLYTALGADYRAMLLFNLFTFLCRVFTLGLLVWRCRFVKE